MVYVTNTPRSEQTAGTRPKPYLVTEVWVLNPLFSITLGEVPASKLLIKIEKEIAVDIIVHSKHCRSFFGMFGRLIFSLYQKKIKNKNRLFLFSQRASGYGSLFQKRQA